MARNRQKAKERQARRKAQQRGSGDGAPARADRGPDSAKSRPPSKEDAARAEGAAPAEPVEAPEPAQPEPAEPARSDEAGADPVVDAHLRAGAPPQDVGHSDEVLEYEQDLAEDGAAEGRFDPAEDFPEEDLTSGPEGRRRDAAKHKERPRFVQFLIAVWAELQRVQWPDRQALTTLTGIVLGFVLIAGGYLGLLDAIFSRIIQAIL